MKKDRWIQALKASADPTRAKDFLELLAATPAGARLAKCSGEQIAVFAAVFGGSPALGNLLLAHPDWLSTLDVERLCFARRAQGFRAEVNGWLPSALAAGDSAAAFSQLRRFKERELLRIAARDLARLGNVVEITRELSDVADVCLDAVWRICRRQFTERFGQPYH